MLNSADKNIIRTYVNNLKIGDKFKISDIFGIGSEGNTTRGKDFKGDQVFRKSINAALVTPPKNDRNHHIYKKR